MHPQTRTRLVVLSLLATLVAALFKAPHGAPSASAPPSHVFAATGRPPIVPASWLIPEWDFDPANVSGVASDNNACTSQAAPCLTYGEIAARWGTYQPILPQTTLVHQMSAQTGISDPVIIRAIVKGNASFEYTGTRTQVQTGTLASVVAKANGTPGSPGNALQATLGAALAVGDLIVNTTRANSDAYLVKNLGGNAWELTQPLTAPTLPLTTRTEINTWANGDAYVVYTQSAVDMLEWTPRTTDINGGFTNIPVLQDVTLADFGANQGGSLVIAYPLFWQDVQAAKSISGSLAGDTEPSQWEGVLVTSELWNVNTVFAQTLGLNYFEGGGFIGNGAFGFYVVAGLDMGLDVVLDNGITVFQVGGRYGVNGVAATDGIYIGTGATWYAAGYGTIRCAGTCTTPIYGPGTLNVGGTAAFAYSGGTATTTFLQTTLLLNGQTTACAIGNTSATATNCNITLTPAHLDAAFGVAGFGGVAFSYWGGARIATLINN